MEPHELATLARRDSEAARRQLDALPLEERAELLARLPGREQSRLIFLSAEPQELVRALPKQAFFRLFHEIGPADGADLVPLASPAQLEFCLDLESWRRGRLDPSRVAEWLGRLLEAGARPLFRTLAHLDFELLVAFFAQRLRVEKRDPDTDPLEQDDPSLHTLDDFHQFAFEDVDEETQQTLLRVLKVIRDRAPDFLLLLLEAVRQELPSRVEEEARHFRDGRLADEGLPDYDAALELFARVEPRDIDEPRHRKVPNEGPGAALGTASGDLVRTDAASASFLESALAAVDPAARPTIERELVQIFNSAIVATVEDLGDLGAVRRAGERVRRHLTLGLQELSAGQVRRAAVVLEEARVQSVFQVGWTRVADLRTRATRLARKPWFVPFEGQTAVLGHLADQTIGALREEEPSYPLTLDRDGEVGTRPLEDLADVQRLEAVLERAEAIALFLFERSGLTAERWPEIDLHGSTITDHRDLVVHQVLATTLANALLDGRPRFEPIPAARLDALRDRVVGTSRETARTPVDPGAAAALEAWMAPLVADLPLAVTGVVRRYVEECVEALRRELAPFADGAPVDPLALPTLVVRLR